MLYFGDRFFECIRRGREAHGLACCVALCGCVHCRLPKISRQFFDIAMPRLGVLVKDCSTCCP